MGELFEVDSWIYGKNKKYKITKQLSDKSIAIISGITENNGINAYTNDVLDKEEIFEKEITISTRGEYSGTAFYHKYKFVLANNILVMKMPKLTENQKKFMVTIINNLNYGGYDNYPKKETLKKDKIKLPIKDNEIDFDFMENFIDELEKAKINQVKEYLKENNLDDYNLTDKEKEVLVKFENKEIKWGKYNLKELFGEASRGKRLKSLDRIKGNLPFVTAGESNEGISDFIGNNIDVFSENTITIDMFGSAKYRNYKYGADDHISVIHTNHLNKLAVIFITSAIHKSSYTGEFNYGRNFYPKDADNLEIQLPIKDNEEIDFEFMETLISAIQKLVVKNVIKYLQEKGS